MLYSKTFPGSGPGAGPDILILHGLFGSHTNWGAIARNLSSSGYTVHTPDLRNHGRSFHDPVHTPEAMADDVLQWMAEKDQLVSDQLVIVGHSMGGIVALTAALKKPEAFAGLVIVDIVPKPYFPRHQKEFEALRTDFTGVADRTAAEEKIKDLLPNPQVRGFILTNLERRENGFEWRINVPALAAQFDNGEVQPNLPPGNYSGPSLCIYGGDSGYVQPEDHATLQELCPEMDFVKISGAGHWLHYSHADAFLERLKGFLSGL